MQENQNTTEALGKTNSVLLLVFNEQYNVKNARLLVRVGHESRKSTGTVHATTFRKESKVVRLHCLRRYAVPIKLDTGYKTTFVEVVDTATDTSCVFLGRHGEYTNPYGVKRTKEAVMEVTVPVVEPATEQRSETDAEVLSFVSSVIRLADVTGRDTANWQMETDNLRVAEEREREVSVDPILEIEAQYKSCQPVCVENVHAKMITGVYWCNEHHWMSCNDGLLAAPLSDSLYPINAAWSMPVFLRQLHMCFIKSLETCVEYDCTLPHDITDKVMFPHLFMLEPSTLTDLYTGVGREVLLALSLIYQDIPFPPTAVNFTDFKDSYALITRERLYRTNGLDVLRNPFSPWTNSFFCRRWDLEEYTSYRMHLGEALCEVPEHSSSWCKFIVQDGLVESVKHASGQTYGEVDYDVRPLQTLRIQLMKLSEAVWIESEMTEATLRQVQTSIDEMILRGLGKRPAIVCYANVDDGRMYVTHPLFPPGRCVAFYTPLMSCNEIELLMSQVKPAAESLYRHFVTKM